MIRLRWATPEVWVRTVLADLDAFLVDHAACERKASAMALHLVAHYRDRQRLVDAMVEFACEELDHFRQVYALVRARGLILAPDAKDAYVNALQAKLRKGTASYFMDRLLLAGVIEARGCERFGLLSRFVRDPELRSFYRDLTRAEARHQQLFYGLALEYFDATDVDARLDEWLALEAEIAKALPPRPALH